MAKGTLVKIDPNGSLTPVRVEDQKGWTIKQLYHLIGCDIVEGVRVKYEEKPRIAYVDENARVKRDRPPINPKATEFYRAYYGPDATEILGVAVIWIPDDAPGVGRRGVISTKRKRAKGKGNAEPLPTLEGEDVQLAVETLEAGPNRDGIATPAAPGADEI